MKISFKLFYWAALSVILFLKIDVLLAKNNAGLQFVPKSEAVHVTALTQAVIRPWNFTAFNEAIAPEMKKKIQSDGLPVFFQAVSRKLGYVREVGKAVYVPESLYRQWLAGGRLYHIQADCLSETVQFEMRVRQKKEQIELYEFAILSDTLKPLYESALKAYQNGNFKAELFHPGK